MNYVEKSLNEAHENSNIKVSINNIIKEAKDKHIPMFIAYKTGDKYSYNGVFPEEIDDPLMEKEYGKFIQFMKVCSDFNKENYASGIHLNND